VWHKSRAQTFFLKNSEASTRRRVLQQVLLDAPNLNALGTWEEGGVILFLEPFRRERELKMRKCCEGGGSI